MSVSVSLGVGVGLSVGVSACSWKLGVGCEKLRTVIAEVFGTTQLD